MKAYEEGKGPAKREDVGPELKASLGMTMSFGSLAANKRQAVYWATLERILSGLFHTQMLSTFCVPNPVPDSEIGYESGSISELPKGMGCCGGGHAPIKFSAP